MGLLGPKIEPKDGTGVRYHAKERPKATGGSEWYFQGLECSLIATSMLLVRIMIGKVTEGNRVVEILHNTPIRIGQPEWNCVSWVKEALEMLNADGKALGTSTFE